jgi:hypothetical protein
MVLTVALLGAGCGNIGAQFQPSTLPLCYRNDKYDLTFFLPASWQGYSVLLQQWDGVAYSPAADKTIVTGHGMMITLRHPQWTAKAPYQDIPILVFTHAQWDALNAGKLWPSFFAGGTIEELWQTQKYVFAMSSRYALDDSVKEWKETTDIVQRNHAAHTTF